MDDDSGCAVGCLAIVALLVLVGVFVDRVFSVWSPTYSGVVVRNTYIPEHTDLVPIVVSTGKSVTTVLMPVTHDSKIVLLVKDEYGSIVEVESTVGDSAEAKDGDPVRFHYALGFMTGIKWSCKRVVDK